MLSDLLYRFRALFHRPQLESELNDELRFHLERQVEKHLNAGVPRPEAERRARLELGGLEQTKEACRDSRGVIFFETLVQDIRYSLRVLRKSPGFTVVAVLTLALGIGANTAIFSLINAVLLRPLPYREPDRLLMVWSRNTAKGLPLDLVSAPDFRDWTAQNRVFESMAASTDANYTLTGHGDPLQVLGYRFSADFFHVLDVPPLIGRTFLPEEEQPGKNHVVVLSYALWRTRFGGDRGVLGTTITLNGEPCTVIGVMPEGYKHPGSTELWTPLTVPATYANRRDVRFLRVVARLKPGVTLAQAQAEMKTIAGRLAATYPKENAGEDVNLVSLREMQVGDIRPALLVLLAAVTFVLLIVCANLASLLLSRTAARQREIAVRVALGGGRARLLRQFLTESLLLSVLGAALGVLLASRSVALLVAMFPPTIANLQIPKLDNIPIDGGVLAFALGITLITGVVFGAVPALQVSRTNPADSLKEAGRQTAGGRKTRRLRSSFVVTEIALSLMLLAAAGLMMRSLWHLMTSDSGFDAHNVLTFRTILPKKNYDTDSKQVAFVNAVTERIQALPGVQTVGSVTFLPLSGWWGLRGVSLAGTTQQGEQPTAIWSSVTPDYFRSLQISVLAGRPFTAQDAAGSPAVAIVSRGLARQLGRANALGGQVILDDEKLPREIVGIVADVLHFGPAGEARPQVYIPFAQAPVPIVCWTVRADGDAAALAAAVKRAVWEVDKDQPVSYLVTMEQLVSETMAPQRISVLLLGVFAVLALVLATVGIYGVVSYSTAQRTQEIGIRMAVGARPVDVLKLVLGQGLGLTLIGAGVGLTASWLLARYLTGLLYGVRPHDLATLAAVSALLALVATTASYFPARRAMRVDPMVALRNE